MDPELEEWRIRRREELERPAASVVDVIEVHPASLEALVRSHPLVLVDVWAAWCGPCRAMSPIVAELARERRGRLVVAKLDADAHPDWVSQQGVASIPTFLFFREGRPAARLVGARPKRDFVDILDRLAGEAGV